MVGIWDYISVSTIQWILEGAGETSQTKTWTLLVTLASKLRRHRGDREARGRGRCLNSLNRIHCEEYRAEQVVFKDETFSKLVSFSPHFIISYNLYTYVRISINIMTQFLEKEVTPWSMYFSPWSAASVDINGTDHIYSELIGLPSLIYLSVLPLIHLY